MSSLKEDKVILEGTLKIRGFFSTWKKHWFVLREGRLTRYKSSTSLTTPEEEIDFRDAASMSIQVVNAESLSGKKNTLGIFIQGKSPLIVLAESEKMQKMWIDALKQSIQNCYNATQQQLSPSADRTAIHSPVESVDLAPNDKVLELLEAIIDSCVITDEKCFILGFNQSAEQMFGWKKSEVLNCNVTKLMPSSYARFHDKFISSYFMSGNKKLIGVPRALLAKKKDGTTVPVLVSLGEIPQHKTGETKAAFMAIFRYMDESNGQTSSSSNPSDTTYVDPAHADNDHSLSSNQHTGLNSMNNLMSGSGSGSGGSGGSGSGGGIIRSDDMSTSLKYTQLKFQGKLNDFMDEMSQMLKSEYEDIEKRFMTTQNKTRIMDQENKRLEREIEDQNSQLQTLNDELEYLKKKSDIYPLLCVLRNTAGYHAFYNYVQSQKNDCRALQFWKECEDFRSKHYSDEDFSALDKQQETLRKDAELLLQRYIQFFSETEYAKIIAQLLKSNHLNPNLFLPVKKDLLLQLKPLFQKFCETGTGKAVIESL